MTASNTPSGLPLSATRWCLAFGGLGVAVGLALLVSAIMFSLQEDFTLDKSANPYSYLTMGFWLTVGAIVLGSIGIIDLPEIKDNETGYQRYTVGVGYALLVLASLNLLAISGLGYRNLLVRVFPTVEQPASAPPGQAAGPTMGVPLDPAAAAEKAAKAEEDARLQAKASGVLLLTTLSMAILGALFFVANSLMTKSGGPEPFRTNQFWAGLWFRLGQSVLFTIVLFMAIRRMSPDHSSDFWLPLLSLFIGMFIKTGERLIAGLAQRSFKAAEAFIGPAPNEPAPESAPGVPIRVKAERNAAGDGVLVTWHAPADGGTVTNYVVEQSPKDQNEWTPLAEFNGDTLQCDHALENADQFDFRVAARNQAVRGTPSDAVRIS